MPSSEIVTTPLPTGIVGDFGLGMRRFLLVAYAQGQVLRAGQGEYLISEVVLNSLRGCALAGPVVEQLVARPVWGFADKVA
jgi:hypothetical protein